MRREPISNTQVGLALLFAMLLPVVGCTCGGNESVQAIVRDRDAAAVVYVDRKPVGGPVADEIEPNNAELEAMPLPVPGRVKGTLDGEKDIDVYRLEVTESGWLSVEVNGIAGVDLVLALRDVDGKELVRSDRGPAKTGEGVPNYPVQSGTYYLAISEFVSKKELRRRARAAKKKNRKRKRKKKSLKKKAASPTTTELGRVGPSPAYELEVRVVTGAPRRGREVEPNQETANAGAIQLGAEGTGYVGWRGDVDLWRVPLDGLGEDYGLDLNVSPIEGVRLTLEVLDDNAEISIRRKAGMGASVGVRGYVARPGQDNIYVRIKGRGSSFAEPYALRVGSHLLGIEEEREPNDGRSRATPMRERASETQGERRGALLPGDSDYYSIASEGGTMQLSVSVEPPENVNVKLKLMTSKGVVLGEANAGKRGEREELIAVPIPAGARAIVVVSGDGSADPVAEYTLRWSTVTGAAPASTGGDDDYDPYEQE